jgi:protein phosphatase
MTQDHSLVEEMVQQGELTPEEARTHESRNMVTRILGTKRQVEVTVWDEPFPVRGGDRFLLCSDGLHDLLTSDEMLTHSITPSLEAATSGLIAEANGRGGFDNISAVIVEVAERPRETAASLSATRRIGADELPDL